MNLRLFLSILSLCFISIIFPENTLAKEPLKVVFGISRPPFIDNDPPRGISWELANAVFKKMQVEIIPSFYPNKRMERALIQGDVDIAVEVQPTHPDLYYSNPFISYRNFVVTRKREDITFRNWQDLTGYRVNAWQGALFHLGTGFRKVMRGFKLYKEFPLQKAQVQRWLLGSFDAIIIDETLLAWWIQTILPSLNEAERNQLDLNFTYAPVPQNNELWWYVGFRDPKLRDTFNIHLQSIQQNGDYARIREQYKLPTH
ncbi:substrate-binding periplasmic protein [Terasakiella sp.]|uniref:substrate-binding periplasmic protein n=1 Tax=Terasakiella sp. TaxID=2034861 RepID=UPI003AA83A4B